MINVRQLDLTAVQEDALATFKEQMSPDPSYIGYDRLYARTIGFRIGGVWACVETVDESILLVDSLGNMGVGINSSNPFYMDLYRVLRPSVGVDDSAEGHRVITRIGMFPADILPLYHASRSVPLQSFLHSAAVCDWRHYCDTVSNLLHYNAEDK